MNYAKHAMLPVAALTALLLLSCSPVIHYFGDSYPSSSSVEVYYDPGQVKKEYKTIGHMTKEVIKNEYDKKHMIELAKKKGADGIIFSDLSLDKEKSGSMLTVKAELIKYL